MAIGITSPGLDKLSPKSHKCVFLGFIRAQKGYKCFSPSLNPYFISADVTFSESSLYFKSCLSPSISSSNEVNIPLVLPSAPNNSPLPPTLQGYSRRHMSHRPLEDSIPVPTPHPPPAPTVEPPTVEPDLPITICKGIPSTRNPSPHYTALSYHRLSQPFYTCLSSVSSVSIPKFVGDALAHPGWRQAIHEKRMRFRIMELGNLFLYHLGNLLLVAGGFLLSKLVLMVLLIVSKLVLWLRVIPKFLL